MSRAGKKIARSKIMYPVARAVGAVVLLAHVVTKHCRKETDQTELGSESSGTDLEELMSPRGRAGDSRVSPSASSSSTSSQSLGSDVSVDVPEDEDILSLEQNHPSDPATDDEDASLFLDEHSAASSHSISFLVLQVVSIILAIPVVLASLSACATGIFSGHGLANCTVVDNSAAKNASSTECPVGFEPRTPGDMNEVLASYGVSAASDFGGFVLALIGRKSLTVGVERGAWFRQAVLGACSVAPIVSRVEDLRFDLSAWTSAPNATESTASNADRCVKSAEEGKPETQCP